MLFRYQIKAVLALVTVSTLVSPSTADCASETAQIQLNTTVGDALDAVVDGTLELQDPSTCAASGSTLTCSYDVSTVDSNYDNTCQAFGGQVVDGSFSITCTVEGTSSEVTYLFSNAPRCIGESCDTTTAEADFKNITNMFASTMNEKPGLSNCDAATKSGSGPAMAGASALLLSTGSLLLSIFLFY